MASVTTRLGARKKTKEVQKNHAETEKLVHEPQKGDIEEESTINALRLEIENLKRKLSAKEETIDELDRERDEIYKEHYDLRVALADAWKIRLATDSDNVKEVAKLLGLKKGFGSKSGNSKPLDKHTRQLGPKTLEKAPTYASMASTTVQADTDTIVNKIAETLKTQLHEVLDARLGQQKQNEGDCATKIKQIMQEDRKEQRDLQRERKLRSSNIVIHGVAEEEGVSDEGFAKDLFETLDLKLEPKKIIRLGKEKRDFARPIKIVLKTEKEKNDVMNALPRLRHTTASRLRKVSVTNDYTIAERNEIARWVAEAKLKTASEKEGCVWKVRGIPFGNLRLVKIRTQQDLEPTRSSQSDS